MNLSDKEKKELLKMAKSRVNRRAFRAARDLPSHMTFDEFIRFLDDVQCLRADSFRGERPFVPYKFNPF